MKLVLLIILVMLAFAANSVLGRWAIGPGHMDGASFGLLRLVAGALALMLLCHVQGLRPLKLAQHNWRRSLFGGASLTLYMAGFTLAYADLDAGLGALVLFGVVQVLMFGWGVRRGQSVTPFQWIGAGGAFLGLTYVVLPGAEGAVSLSAAILMGLSGVGWGIYSVVGQGEKQPVAASAVNFSLASLMILPMVVFAAPLTVTPFGVMLAVLSGAVTSGLGYALWYRVLPEVPGQVAATVQLSVPVIAILAGAVVLGEPIGTRLMLGSAAVLGGIAVVILCRPRG